MYPPVGIVKGQQMTRLREARRNAKTPIRQVAERVGVALSTVQRWESGESSPRYSELEKLAVIYGTTVEELSGEKPLTPAAERASFAAGVLWAIAQQAHHIEQMAMDAHQRITGASPASPVTGAAVGPSAFGLASDLLAQNLAKASRPAKKKA
jgi:transcriptional regulator with XRE-family HTH domain